MLLRDPSGTPTSRRHFLTLGWAGLLASALLILFGIFRYATQRIRHPAPSPFPVGFPTDFPLGSLTQKQGIWIGKDQGGLYAISGICPHLGCRLKWNGQEGHFLCPCHGSLFDREGVPLQGPADRPMPRLLLMFGRKGEVLVNPGKAVGADFRLKVE